MGPADWERIERSAEFRELVAKRRRFVLPATIFFLSWYFGFIFLSGYAENFMGQSLIEGFTVGYALALTQFLMVAVLGVAYLRYSERVLDPLRARLVELVGEPTAVVAEGVASEREAGGRFVRGPTPSTNEAPPEGAPRPPREVPR